MAHSKPYSSSVLLPRNRRQFSLVLAASLAVVLGGVCIPAVAQNAVQSTSARIVKPIDNTQLITLRGNTHPATQSGKDLGPVDSEMLLTRMQLLLQRSPEQQAALDAFMVEQYDPNSPNFHHWLSPEQYGQLYGPSDADIATLTAWLQSQGMTVSSVSKGRIAIEFNGTAGQIKQAFHTELHHYTVHGEAHIANNSDPKIPEAISPVVMGVIGLNDFRAKSQMIPPVPLQRDSSGRLGPAGGPQPNYTINSLNYYVAPGDFATIYNTTPLLNSGINGSGVTVAIVARSNILPSDITTYRTMFGLTGSPYTLVLNGADPGLVAGDQGENTLDVEMAGMAAPGAKILLVLSGAYSGGADGVTLSQLYIIDNQLAPIMSTSFGLCELSLGTSGNSFNNALEQQAAAEGISSFLSSGDSGASECENDNLTYHLATTGLEVSGTADTPYDTSVGGTDFNDVGSYATYWSGTNSLTGSSALKYIPENPWNSTCTNPLLFTNGYISATTYCNYVYALGSSNTTAASQISNVGGGGGVSNCTAPTGTTASTCAGGYAKPSWQTGPGVPADGKRDSPDVSLFAANGAQGNSWALYVNGALSGSGGTSASAPAMAGIMALVVQKQGSAQGLANPVFYKLAAAQTTANCNSSAVVGTSCVFYDITSGNNDVPCQNSSTNCTNGTTIGVMGNASTTGYDTATGLGSVNAYNLVNTWSTQSGTPTITVTLSPTTLPNGYVNVVQYYQQITAGGGTPPYTYTLISGALPPGLNLSSGGLLGGVPTAGGTYSFTIRACDSTSVNGPVCGSQAYSVTPQVATNPATIHWIPGSTFTFNGLPIGSGVLNATTTNSGTVSYTFQVFLNSTSGAYGGYNGAATAATVLAPGQYLLIATNSADASQTQITFTVLQQHEWVIKSAGSLTGLDAGGNSYVSNTTGGGLGLAIDSGGSVWSINASGSSVSVFTNTGALSNTYSSGISSAKALAIDGNNITWIANGNGTVTALSNLGTAVFTTPIKPAGGTAAAGSISVDTAGSLWISTPTGNSITEVIGAATPVATPTVTQVINNTPGTKP